MSNYFAIGCAVAGILFSVSVAHADETRPATTPALQLSVSDALKNASGSIIVAGRYGDEWGVRAGFWAHAQNLAAYAETPNVFFAVDRMITVRRLRAGLGIAWIDEVNNVNGTRWNFIWSMAVDLPDRFFLELLHMSHGAALGIEEDKPNHGWNFIGIGRTF